MCGVCGVCGVLVWVGVWCVGVQWCVGVMRVRVGIQQALCVCMCVVFVVWVGVWCVGVLECGVWSVVCGVWCVGVWLCDRDLDIVTASDAPLTPLPIALCAPPAVVKRSDGMITAVEHGGLTCMSYGFVAKRKSSGERVGAFLRGPMASRYVTQVSVCVMPRVLVVRVVWCLTCHPGVVLLVSL